METYSDGVSDDIRQGSLFCGPTTFIAPMLPAFKPPQWNTDDTGQQQQTASHDERPRV